MSVMLYNLDTISKIEKGLASQKVFDAIKDSDHYIIRNADEWTNDTPREYLGRMLWYMYVANRTAYNLQYKENETIEFEDIGTKDDVDFKWAVDTLGSLNYNCHTNDGNYFIADGWLDTAEKLLKLFRERRHPSEY
jgi:hypothetical protein